MNKFHLDYFCKFCKAKIHYTTSIYGNGVCVKCYHKSRTKEKNKCKNCEKNISRKSKYCQTCFNKTFKTKWDYSYCKIIKRLYQKDKLTQYQIAKILNTNQSTISYLMKKFCIFIIKIKKIYKCCDCEKEIAYGSKRCISCENKRKHKMGILDSKGANNPAWKGGKPNCVDCNKKISGYNYSRCKRCRNIHYAMIGNTNPAFGKTYWYSIKYNNTKFKSTWEANFAKWCDLSGVQWEYEPKAFLLKINGKDTTYTPDFYLLEFDLWIEIKGYWWGNSKNKYFIWKKKYRLNTEVLQEKDLEKIGIL